MSIKHLLQGTAIGLFIATSTFTAVYFLGDSHDDNDTNVEEFTREEAITLLESEEYSIIKEDELAQLYNEIEQLEIIVEENNNAVEVNEDNEEIEENEDAAENNNDDQDEIEEEEQVEEFVLNIVRGTHSRNIGEVLKQYDIVEDERDFEQYALDEEIDKDIRIGEYELTSDMSIEEIVDIITNP